LHFNFTPCSRSPFAAATCFLDASPAGFCRLFDELFQINFACPPSPVESFRAAARKRNLRSAFSNSVTRAKIFPEDSGETGKC
jgi:hypothetical protein